MIALDDLSFENFLIEGEKNNTFCMLYSDIESLSKSYLDRLN